MTDPAIQFASTRDGVSIAFWTMGEGPPLIYLDVPGFSHVQLELSIAPYRVWHDRLSRGRRLVRLDFRGTGASGRIIEGFSVDSLAADVMAVVDKLHLRSFSLFARDGASPVAIKLATACPERLHRLILFNPWTNGAELPIHASLAAAEPLIDVNWHMFSEMLARVVMAVPDEEAAGVAAFLRRCTTPEGWKALAAAQRATDVTHLLARIGCPVLVISTGRTKLGSLDLSRQITSQIPDAQLLWFEGAMVPLGDTGAVGDAIEAFLGEPAEVEEPEPSAGGGAPPHQRPVLDKPLSPRELEVLRFIALGRTNQEIADELVVSLHTVRRHVSNILSKIDVSNRTQAARYASRWRLLD
ncbi:MAG: hypothetical protein HYX53_04330 [Chloroflexi bacterium]|nr:hypothetical protein [Chloroflexota bacterium]